MNSRPLVIVLLALLPGLTFCKKPNETNRGSVAGKWKADSVQLRQVFTGHIEYQTIYVPAADYYDFRADRQLYRYWMGIYDTVPYEIAGLNDRTLIKYPGTADTILVLTDRSLVVKNPQGNDSKLFLSR